MNRCNWCKVEQKEFEEKNDDVFLDEGACTKGCRQALNDAYDDYVDPSGFYRRKALDPYE